MRASTTLMSLMALAWAASTSLAQPVAPVRASRAIEWRIVVDDLHLSFTETGRLRAFLTAVVEDARAHGEAVGLRSTGPTALDVAPTMDAPPLRAAIMATVGNGLKDVDVLRAWGEPAARDREPSRRADIALGALRLEVDHAPGAGSVVVFVTQGLSLAGAALTTATAPVTEAASRHEVRILAVDPRDPARLVPPPPPDLAAALADLHARQAASLERLALSTGGEAARGLADTLSAMAALRH